MSLTWKDAVATLLTGGVGLIAYAKLVGWNVPFLSNWRFSILAIFVLGIGACIAASPTGSPPVTDAWNITAGVIGGLALVLVMLGLIFDNRLVFILLASDIGLLWIVSTMHHLVTQGV